MPGYDDIIHLPHPTSTRHPRMSREMRAAQFAPFAALTGYAAAVRETARRTDGLVELDSGEIERINRRLFYLAAHLDEELPVTVTYFKPDTRKLGGSYETVCGILRAIDEVSGRLILSDRTSIPLVHITELECNSFTAEFFEDEY